MTRAEFVNVMAYLSAGVAKSISEETAEVYWSLLGDLAANVFQTAAKRVLLEHPWSTFPSVAELRASATASQRGNLVEMSPAEAWAIAWKAAGRIDPESEGAVERVMKTLPPLVSDAMRTFGVNALCYGKEPVAVIRSQFMKTFDQIATREVRYAILPESVKREVLSLAPARQAAAKLVDAIGKSE